MQQRKRETRHPFHEDSVPSGKAGCAGSGRSLHKLAFIGIHVSVAHSYPHDSLLRVKRQVLVANGMSRAELLKGGLRAGMVGTFC